MKRLLLLLFCVLVIGCGNNTTEPQLSANFLKASVDGGEWAGNRLLVRREMRSGEKVVVISSSRTSDYSQIILSLDGINGTGVYTFKNDVQTDPPLLTGYSADKIIYNAKYGQYEISEFTPNKIKGKFSFTALNIFDFDEKDSLRVSNGEFDVTF